MKINKYIWNKYILVILGIILLYFLFNKRKEPFVQQLRQYIYSSTSYDGKTYEQHNLEPKISDINSEDCFNLCISKAGCTGYVIDSSYCQLKEGNIVRDNLVDKSDSKTIIINKMKGNIKLDKNKNSKAITIREYNNVSYTDCYNYCINNDNCRGFVTDFDLGNGPGKCQLKTNDLFNNNNNKNENGKFTTMIA